MQLVLVECLVMTILAACIGGLFAWWSAPFVVSRVNPPDNPARLALPADFRIWAFGIALTLGVTLLFGLASAIRASAVQPAIALKGGDDPKSHHRVMYALIATQVAFCFVVLFVAGLFTTTFERLSDFPLGFSADRLLVLDTIAARPQAPVVWEQVAEHLRTVPGVEKVAMAGWPLLTPNGWNGFVSVEGEAPGPELAYFLNVSPGWADAMKIAFVQGRDFLSNEPAPSAAIVNETFVKHFLNGRKPIGVTFAKGSTPYRIVGVVRDAPYRSIRESILPSAYVDTRQFKTIRQAALIVRTASADPLAIASVVRQEVPRARSDFRVSNLTSQSEIDRAQTIRERLLAMLGVFFAGVAVLLAAIGLYGVLNYSVLQRRREIGIRMAIGARAGDIARRVTAGAFAMVMTGAAAGLAIGMASVRYIESLLYGVKGTDVSMVALPAVIIAAAALFAALPAVLRAVRVDPATTLRGE